MSNEHPIAQDIKRITISHGDEYNVGYGGVTRIQATTKSGLCADMAYIRIWKGDVAVAEFCQHNIVGVYFNEDAAK